MSAYAKVDFRLGILSILWRAIWHGFDFLKVLFAVVVIREELKQQLTHSLPNWSGCKVLRKLV